MRSFISFKTADDKRTNLIYKNIIGSFLIKGWTGIVQILLVPVTLRCLNQYEYGVWLTISSILLWIDTFDIGLGNGLRNNLAISIAKNDSKRARRQVSTTLCMLFLIVMPIILLSSIIVNYLDCYHLLNVSPHLVPHLKGIIISSIAIVGASFILKFIGNIYLALQLPAINNLLVALGHTLALLCLLVLSLWKSVTLFHVAVAYTASPLIIYLLSYPITFTKYSHLRPSIALFDSRELRPLFSLGIKFFLSQFMGLVIFASSNILISNLFSPKDVTPYQITYRYFGILNILFTVISAPYWSATTDAYTRNEWDWIKNSIKKLNYVIFCFLIVIVIMLTISSPVYRLWVGQEIVIPIEMSTLMAIYMMVVIYGTCYSNILCGIGKIRLLTINTVFEAIIYIPLAVYLAKTYHIVGIIIALILVNLVSAISNKIQFEKISNGHAKGIWNK